MRRVAIAGNDRNKIIYDLHSTNDDKANQLGWNLLVGSPSGWPGYHRSVPISVGLAGKPIDSEARIDLAVVPRLWGWVSVVVIAAITGLLIALGWRSNLLRDSGPPPVQKVDGKDVPLSKPFSMSRLQLAVWFWTIITCYIFIWVMNGETGSLTGQVLSILAISTLTYAGAIAMDARNSDSTRKTMAEAQQALADTNRQIAENKDVVQNVALAARQLDLSTRLQQLSEQLGTSARTSTSFLEDILSDDDGISFHRFQMLGWTVVLVVIFIGSVWTSIAMPTLDSYLLTLMGISSGTYVGLKSTEVAGS